MMKSIARCLLVPVLLVLPAFATVTVTSPAKSTAVTSPVHFVATATSTCAKGVAAMGVYVNDKLIYTVKAKELNTEIALALGAQHTVVEEWDKCGGASVETVNLTVVSRKTTVKISADPASVKAGASSVLKVVAADATKVTVAGTDGSSYTLADTGGSETVSPHATTTYTATAVGAAATVTSKTTITVTVPAPTVSIKANPTSIVAGSASMLSVVAAYATKVTILGSDGSSYTLAATGGTESVSPTATTTYTVKAVGAKSTVTSKATVTVTAPPAPTISITANPTSINSGSASSLTVVAENSTKVTITGSNGTSYSLPATGGVQSVSPTATTTYTATAVGPKVTTTAKAVVTVTAAPAPTVTLQAVPPSIVTGGSSVLTVTTTNATSVTLTGSDGSTYKMSSSGGTQSVSPTATTKYTATAFGATSGVSVQAAATVTVGAKAITSMAVTASSTDFRLGASQQFTATATYNDNSTADVTATAAWTVANLAVATVDSSGLVTSVASGSTTVAASLNGITGSAPFTVAIASGTGVNVPTWHFDTYRSGLNSNELSLSTTNVSSQTFGKLFSYIVNGYAYAQPLLVSGVTINGSVHNVLYVATETDDVYAFDADNFGSGAPLWHVSLLQSGETPDNPGSSSAIQPTIGVTSTPVIDLSSNPTTTNTMYVVSKQTASGGSFFRLNALDITTGAQKFGGPVKISASVPATNSASNKGVQTLTTACIQRSALLEAYGNIYFGFGSCHTGWLLGYSASTLAQTGVFNASPNLNGEGQWASAGGVWMGGGGPASNGDGSVYITTGNGPWDGKTAWSDSVLQLNPTTLAVQSYFTPQYYQYMDCADGDLASGGLMLIPGSSPPMGLAGAKTGWMYLVNTAHLGGEQANDAGALDTLIFEPDLSAPYSKSCTDATKNTIQASDYEIYSTAAYFNGSVYQGITADAVDIPAGLRQFTLSGTTLTPSTYTAFGNEQNIRGTTPFISSNGASDGVIWMIDQGLPLGNSSPITATLRAFDPTNLSTELYNSNINPSDAPGYGIKFTTPIVANGKVYISTGHNLTTAATPQGEIDVYGLN